DGTTGLLIDTFITPLGELSNPSGIIFDPDGNLYVSSQATNSVPRYDGKTGLYIDDFVPAGSGGLNGPRGIVFGPDGNLYVGSSNTGQVLRYHGATGEFMGIFADGG